jgi:hypothetical protein
MDALGEPPDTIRIHQLFRLAVRAAKREVDSEPMPSAEHPSRVRLSDLNDRIDSVAATQMPMIDSLERIEAAVSRLGQQTKFKIEEKLKEVLGLGVYSVLCDDTKIVLMDAERRFGDEGTIDWNSVVENLAKGLEFQLKQRFLERLARYLSSRNIDSFPMNDETLPNGNKKLRAIIWKGKPNAYSTLGWILNALQSRNPVLADFAREKAVDLSAVVSWIQKISAFRNKAAHEVGMSCTDALRLRGQWFGIPNGDGGAFGTVCGVDPK